ncbi:efflux RND transporter periplasmic adaptor subunit [Roseateles violae]|uniref:efflux RND transporter periplasmic adaptor subunit n=1 Tax=Roseateles violae TaxID=3058042 RepID=UPI0025B620E1|nr:efflux RND transporter periplasmic adaptor subunit [Pelomonas sp. PFR6]
MLASLLALAGCGKDKPTGPATRPPVEVAVITVTPQAAPVTPEFVGQTESSQQVEIRARVSGFLERRVYAEGAPVKAGQVLFLMDKKPFEAQLQAARAELTQQQSRLVVARQNLARVQPLASQNALSKKDLDDAVGQEQTAAAAVEAAKAKLIDAELNLGYCTITSPVAGLSSFAKLQEGSYVSPQNSLLTYVAKQDPMRVNFSLSENELLRVREDVNAGRLSLPAESNFQVEVQLADGSKFPTRGRITFSDASFSQATGTFLMRAEVPNPKGELRPGQFVRVRLIGATRPGSFVVPQRAVQQGPRGEYAWVVDKDGKAEQRFLSVGDWIGDDWLIYKGLRSGDRLIVDGGLKLAPGAPVKITAAAAHAPASGAQAVAAAPAPSPSSQAPSQSAAPAAPGLPLELYFDSGSALLPDDGARQLAGVAGWLAAHPQQRVALSGYADKRGGAAANALLAKRRAQGVRSALLVGGASEAQIELRAPQNITGGDADERARRVSVLPATADAAQR